MHVQRLFLILTTLLLSFQAHARELMESERQAQALAAAAYEGGGRELFCGCTFENGQVRGDCPVQKGLTNATAVSYVPVITVAEYGRRRDCWTQRSNRYVSPIREMDREEKNPAPSPVFTCDVVDPVFRAMEADPFNLVPAVNRAANVRGHRKAAEIESGVTRVEGCGLEVPQKIGTGYLFEPPAASKGDIARIYLYFADRYALPVEPERLATFKAWAKADPVDDQERRIHDALMAKTKTCNPYVLGKQQACW